MALTLRIHHWHRRYLATPEAAARGERAAQGCVLAALERSLDHLGVGGDELILIRTVKLRLAADRGDYADDEIAEHWGQALATAVQAVIDSGDPRMVRRYADELDHVVDFLLAVVIGGDCEAWHFAKFQSLLGPEVADTLDAALASSTPQWPELMRRLSRRSGLTAILRRCSPAVHEQLWCSGVLGIQSGADESVSRPIFAAALELLARLGGAPSHGAVASAFASHAARRLPSANWSDPTQLAEAVFDAFRFLVKHVGQPVLQVDLLDDALESLDWLDRGWLAQRLGAYIALAQGSGATSAADSPPGQMFLADAAPQVGDGLDLSQAAPLSPRQSEWLARWLYIEPRLLTDWKFETPLCHYNRHLALALLAEDDGSIASDPAAAAFVEGMLAQLPIRERLPNNAWPANSIGEIAPPLALAPSKRGDSRVAQVPTKFAGLFLLLRAIRDLRLPVLARAASFPTAEPAAATRLLLELARVWAAQQVDWPLDPGLAEFLRLAGADEGAAPPLPELNPSPEAEAQFQSHIARALVSFGDWQNFALLRVAIGESRSGAPYLLGGDATGLLVPWSQRISSPEHAREVLHGWLNELSAWTDQSVVATADRATSIYLGNFGGAAADFEHAMTPPISRISAEFPENGPAAGTFAATADAIVRHWGRWVRGFRNASSEFLLVQAVRRSGAVQAASHRIGVTVKERPLDVALRMSGLLDDFEALTRDGAVTVAYREIRSEGRDRSAPSAEWQSQVRH